MLLAMAKNLFAAGEADSEAEESVPLSERSDEELMELYADGRVDAFDLLVKRHEKPLFHFIRRSCGRKDQAEEILQEVFLRVIKSASRYEQTAKFTTWVYTIARNLCIDKARKANTRGTEVSMDKPHEGNPDGQTLAQRMADNDADSASVQYDRAQFRKELEQALQALPEEQREVFILREFSGLKYREIADAVDCPVPTVKSRMRYALETLRGHLADYLDHSFDEEERAQITKPED